METIDIEIRIDRKMDVTVHIADVIEGINEAPMKNRWNYISQIINGVQMDLSDTTDEQKGIIKKYLIDKLSLFVSCPVPSREDFLKTMIDWHDEYYKAGRFNIPLDHEQSEYLSWLSARLAAVFGA
jgi:hypothetical protein